LAQILLGIRCAHDPPKLRAWPRSDASRQLGRGRPFFPRAAPLLGAGTKTAIADTVRTPGLFDIRVLVLTSGAGYRIRTCDPVITNHEAKNARWQRQRGGPDGSCVTANPCERPRKSPRRGETTAMAAGGTLYFTEPAANSLKKRLPDGTISPKICISGVTGGE
jgi:hypothetical protein